MDILEKEKIEMEFWKKSKFENPGNFSLGNKNNKLNDAKIFKSILTKYKKYFIKAEKILEIGAGQGWASCIVKKQFNKYTAASDISPYALESLKYWEKEYDTKLDNCIVAKSYEIPIENQFFDLVFCFASAHHFGDHKNTIREIYRILKPNGVCIYMYEPGCRGIFYGVFKYYMNKSRPIVPEDVLLYKDIEILGEQLGFETVIDFYPTITRRNILLKIYNIILKFIPILNKIFPTTVNIIFKKI
ncbi:MAG: class I SAM-dependent methyltransferase [Candidatus Buchananbacteria bacterium]